MIKIISVIKVKPPYNYQAMVDVDADADAERVLIMDRYVGDVYHNHKLQSNKIVKFIVPKKHLLSNSLLVLILDDDGIYNAEVVDGVEPEMIDGNLVNIRP